jgi:hypothetical protein
MRKGRRASTAIAIICDQGAVKFYTHVTVDGLRYPAVVSHFRRRRSHLGVGDMSVESHLSELVRRHQAIEQAIMAEENHPASDEIKLHELKRKKLSLKDEIERLRHQPKEVTRH